MTRPTVFLLAGLAMAGLVATSVGDGAPRLIWNATASVPLGLYAIERQPAFGTGDLVAVMPPAPLAGFMVARGYVAAGVPLLKQVAGLPGQQVCRSGAMITVDTVVLGAALPRDRLGRALPDWQGCQMLQDDQIFLMNRDVRDSLDGRYFGPMPADAVIGLARPLWVYPDDDDHPDGRLVQP